MAKKEWTLKLRIPAWCENYTVSVNGSKLSAEELTTDDASKGYAGICRRWKKGDVVTLSLEMRTKLIEANPLVEEARGQVAIQRGPIIYCLESHDLPQGIHIDDVAIPYDAQFEAVETVIDGARMMQLQTQALLRNEASWKGTLYREASKGRKKVTVKLVPYYAWGNRGKGEMTVWIPAL